VRRATLLAAVALIACPDAPTPGRADARGAQDAPRLDGARLMHDVGVLAHDSMEGRATATPGGARARRWLLAEIAAIGLEPPAGGFELPFAIAGGGDGLRGVNLVGVIPGRTHPERVLVIGAHYDHLGVRRDSVCTGADDDASGVAAVLELGRWFRAHPPASTIIVALFDAEEAGVVGSEAFIRNPPVPLDRMAAMVNLDMVGRNAANELWIAGTAHWPKLVAVAEAAGGRSALTVRLGHDRPGVAGVDDWTDASDHGPFHKAGVPFLYFGEEDHADYHRPTDDVERIQPAFLLGAAETVLDALLVLDTLQAPLR
jgi:Zn-dependent M28 family amino/carboxypeptidase